MWTNVQEIDRNGIIVAFEILYIPLNTFEGVLVQVCLLQIGLQC